MRGKKLLLMALIAAGCAVGAFAPYAIHRWWQWRKPDPSKPVQPATHAAAGSTGPGAEAKTNRILLREVSMKGGFLCRYFRDSRDERTGFVEIYRNGILLDVEEYDLENDVIPPPGTDITGDGIPDRVVLSVIPEGMRSYYSYEIYPALDPENKFKFEAGRTALEFEDLDHDGTYEASGEDWNLEYWFPTYAAPPHPGFVLRFDNEGNFSLLYERMRKPAPTSSELKRRLQEIRKQIDEGPVSNGIFDSDAAPIIWTYMFELVYQGNGKSARKFYDLLWKHRGSLKKDPLFADYSNRSKFLRDFRGEMTMSTDMWFEIMKLNRWRSERDF